MMPAYADSNDLSSFNFSDRALPARELRDGPNGSTKLNGSLPHGSSAMQAAPNGRPARPASIDKRLSQDDAPSRRSRGDAESLNKSPESRGNSSELLGRDDGYFASVYSSETKDRFGGTTQVKLGGLTSLDGTREAQKDFASSTDSRTNLSTHQPHGAEAANQQMPAQPQRVSAPPAVNHNATSPAQHPYRLQQRHTLEVPKLQTSRARDAQNNTDDVVTASGRFSPSTPHRRRGSLSMVRRGTRSINSDMHLDEVTHDEDAARWAEHIRQKRASKRKRKEDEDEDRVVVGTKVDQHHVNWVTAYNMLTGIRFTVSRTNAKMDRDLTDADFDAKHKFSFDMYVPIGFPYLVKHLLESSFAPCGRPVIPLRLNLANTP